MNLKNQPELVKRALEGGLFRHIKFQYQVRVNRQYSNAFYTGKRLSQKELEKISKSFAEYHLIAPESVKIYCVDELTGQTVTIEHKGKVL